VATLMALACILLILPVVMPYIRALLRRTAPAR